MPICNRAAPRWKNGPPQLSTEPAATTHLPLHLVGLVAVSEAEGGSEVAAEEVLLLDAGQDGLVNSLLVASTGTGNLLLLFIANTLVV